MSIGQGGVLGKGGSFHFLIFSLKFFGKNNAKAV
jgi:hypothetical protein